MLGDLAHGPDPVRIGAGDVVHRGAAGIVLDMADLLVEIVGGEIDAGPARHQGERALRADVPAIVGVFGLGLGFGAAENDGEHAEHQDFSGVAPGLGGEFANRGDARRDDLGRRSRHEHAFGVLRRELPSARRGAGLIQHRRALWRGLAEVNGVDPVIVALMPDAMHLGRIGEDAARAVAQRRVVFPASFPELVDDLHIFVGDVVAIVMRGLLVLAGAARGAVEIAGHDVPADPPSVRWSSVDIRRANG